MFIFLLQTVAWLVAALVILINGYLLLEFFSAEVNGVFFGTVVCAFTAAYVAFIVYLIFRDISISCWRGLVQSKRTTDTGNWIINSNTNFSHLTTHVFIKSKWFKGWWTAYSQNFSSDSASALIFKHTTLDLV